MNSYEILGVDPNCSIEEIKATYYKLVREHHPDKSKNDKCGGVDGNNNNLTFIQIQEAWEEIKKNEKITKLNVMSNTVDRHELTIVDDLLYSYPCRCGEIYEIYVEDLEQNYNTFQCQGCSLYVTVDS